MVCLVQTVHLSCTDINTVSKWTKIKFHTTHATHEFHWVRPQLFMSLWYLQCKPCTYLVSRLALSPNGPNRAPPDPRHLGVPSSASKMMYEPIVHLTQIEHLSWTDANTVSNTDQNEIPQDPHQLGVPSGASYTISETIVRLMQTVHQSCIKSSTIPNQTEPSFHLSHVTKESHRVRPKRFLCLWYVRCKPCTYLALTLTLFQNGLK
jgi:hypothetical protein